MCVLFSSPLYFLLFNTYYYCRECRQGASVTFGGPSGVPRPLADTSESANQWDLEIETERGVTITTLIYIMCVLSMNPPLQNHYR
jgi:hypothetical protein